MVSLVNGWRTEDQYNSSPGQLVQDCGDREDVTPICVSSCKNPLVSSIPRREDYEDEDYSE